MRSSWLHAPPGVPGWYSAPLDTLLSYGRQHWCGFWIGRPISNINLNTANVPSSFNTYLTRASSRGSMRNFIMTTTRVSMMEPPIYTLRWLFMEIKQTSIKTPHVDVKRSKHTWLWVTDIFAWHILQTGQSSEAIILVLKRILWEQLKGEWRVNFRHYVAVWQ